MARNIRYLSASDVNGGAYTWLAVHRSVTHNPYSNRPAAVYDNFIPSRVYLPFSRQAPYFDQLVIDALNDPNTSRVAQDPVNGPCYDLNEKTGLGEYPFPNNRLDRVPMTFFIKTSDIGDFDLRNYTASGDATPGINFSSSESSLTGLNYFKGVRHTGSAWSFEDITQQGKPLQTSLNAVHPSAGIVDQSWQFFSGNYAPATPGTAMLRSTFEYRTLNTNDDFTFVAFDPHTREWMTSDDDLWTLDGTVDTFHPATATFDIAVKKYGDDMFDISQTIQFLPGTGDLAFDAGVRPKGTTFYKAKFPHKASDNTPLRYVRYHRPQHGVTASNPLNLAAPLLANSGFTVTVCSDDFQERTILDNVLGDFQRVLLFGDRTLVDLGDTGSTATTVDARRLKLPTPTIEDTCRVTLPWNGEVVQFDRANETYDFALSTEDLLSWKSKMWGKNSSSSKEVWATLVPADLAVYVEYGIIARSRHFNGRFPYAHQVHSNESI